MSPIIYHIRQRKRKSSFSFVSFHLFNTNTNRNARDARRLTTKQLGWPHFLTHNFYSYEWVDFFAVTDLDNFDMIYASVCNDNFFLHFSLLSSFFIHLKHFLLLLLLLETSVVLFRVVMFSFLRLVFFPRSRDVSCLLSLLININNDDDNRLGGD